jgi:hypothetical protein
MKASIRTFGQFLNPFQHGDRRTGDYYRGVIEQGAGYPTYDEARRDLARRDRATSVPPVWH